MDPRAQDANFRIRSLTDVASDVKLDHHIPFSRYLRSGTEMLQVADASISNGNLETAYVLCMKYLILFIEKAGEHPDYIKMGTDEKSNLLGKLEQVMTKTESLKHDLVAKFQREHDEYLKENN